MHWRPFPRVLSVLLGITGCVSGDHGPGELHEDASGGVGDDDDDDDDSVDAESGGSSGGDSPSDTSPSTTQGDTDTGDPTLEARLPARVWRLTHAQYRNAVLDLFAVDVDTTNFAIEVDNGVFPNFAAVSFVNDDLAADYFDAARDVSEQVAEARLLEFVAGGRFEAGEADGFIARVVAAAFRRPGTDAEHERYRAIFDLAASLAPTDVAAPFRAVVRGALSSPHFLYRAEYGAPRLTGYEVASLLSFSLLDEPPSAELLDAAAQGELEDDTGIAEAIARLLQDPRAETVVHRFLTQWLELSRFDSVEKQDAVFPGFESVRADMERELHSFLEAHGTLSNGSLSELLTAEVPSVSPALDTYYIGEGAAAPLPERTGVLALGTVLAQHGKPNLSSPTLRGLFVRKRFFCQHIELPPGFNPPPLSETEMRDRPETTRELYARHAEDPTCRGCHALLDPIGFNLEEYDGGGRYRRLENGHPVDAQATLQGTDVDGDIANTAELTGALARSTRVAECMAAQAFRYYLGAVEPTETFDAVVEAHIAAGDDAALQPLLAALMSSASLRERTVE